MEKIGEITFKIIEAIYSENDKIVPIGKTEKDDNGNNIKCPNCKKGILYHHFEKNIIKCTRCDYIKQSKSDR